MKFVSLSVTSAFDGLNKLSNFSIYSSSESVYCTKKSELFFQSMNHI